MRVPAPTDLWLRQFLRHALIVVALGLLLLGRAAFAGDEMPYGHGVLWKVERGGLAPNYLFGTIHITDERVLRLPDEVAQAFDGARSATFEVIMTDEVRLRLAKAMVAAPDRTLDRVLSPALYRDAIAAGARFGFGSEQLRYFKPWALAMFLSVPQAEFARSAMGALPLDQALQDRARAQGKPVYQLETGTEQIALFDEMTEADQLAMLESAIRDSARIETLFEELTARYLARDVGGIQSEMIQQSKSMDDQLVKMFLLRFNEERNLTMVQRMAVRLGEGGAFIAIGALHLPGETGLLSLLAAQGYQISRIY
ncbi:MAG: TraB/GumN family protein [Proteobacteria bacterium]|nr:TraB/GumN family protein [Pseudomonadota bacterium]